MSDIRKRIMAWLQLEADILTTVTELAEKYLAEFGIQSIDWDHKGMQCSVRLKYCRISFWSYKADVGSAITPYALDSGVSYDREKIDEVGLPLVGKMGSIPYGATKQEIERQMLLIIHNYRDVLEGDLSNWTRKK